METHNLDLASQETVKLNFYLKGEAYTTMEVTPGFLRKALLAYMKELGVVETVSTYEA